MKRTFLALVLALMAFAIAFQPTAANAITKLGAFDAPTLAIQPAPAVRTAAPVDNFDTQNQATLTTASTNQAIVSAVYQQAFLEANITSLLAAKGASIGDIAQSVMLVPLDDGRVAVVRISKVQVVRTSTFAMKKNNSDCALVFDIAGNTDMANARSAPILLTASTAENLGNDLAADNDTAATATRAAPNANLASATDTADYTALAAPVARSAPLVNLDANADNDAGVNLTTLNSNTGTTNARAPNIEAVACAVKTVEAPKLKVEKVAWANSGGSKNNRVALKVKTGDNCAGRYHQAA